jgi:hypothetical protein
MKNLLLLITLSLPFFLHAQDKPGKIRVQQGFLSTKYEIGDKTTPAKQVALHLKNYEPDAYLKWKLADRAGTQSLVWSFVGLTGSLIGLFAEDTNIKVFGWSTGLVGASISLIAGISSSSRRDKAIDIYNRKFGY